MVDRHSGKITVGRWRHLIGLNFIVSITFNSTNEPALVKKNM